MFLPVGELPGRCIAGAPPTCQRAKSENCSAGSGNWSAAGRWQSGIELRDLLEEDADRPAIDDDMVQVSSKTWSSAPSRKRRVRNNGARPRSKGVQASCSASSSAFLSSRPWLARFRQACRSQYLRSEARNRRPATVPRRRRAARPPRQIPCAAVSCRRTTSSQAPLERRDIQWPLQPIGEGQIELRQSGNFSLDPQITCSCTMDTGWGPSPSTRAISSAGSFDCVAACLVDPPGQRLDRGRFEERPDRQRHPEDTRDPRQHPCRPAANGRPNRRSCRRRRRPRP